MSTVPIPRSHVHPNPSPRFPGFAKLPDDALVELVETIKSGRALPLRTGESRADVLAEATAELARRLNVVMYSPTPEERDELENRLAAMDAERFDGLE